MSDPSIERLLRPSLSEDAAPPRAPLSPQVQFLTAFFGGVPGLLICLGANITLMRRWRADAARFAAFALLMLALMVLPFTAPGRPLADALQALLSSGWTSAWLKLVAMVGALGAITYHRRERLAAALAGLTPDSGSFLHGLFIILVGYVLTRGIVGGFFGVTL